MIKRVELTVTEWNVLLSAIQDSLRHFDPYNTHLTNVYQDIQDQLDATEV